MRLVNLVQMKSGEKGIVKEIHGGYDLIKRTQDLGVREGKGIIKLSAHFWRGPVTVAIGTLQIAIGYGMARKIIVGLFWAFLL